MEQIKLLFDGGLVILIWMVQLTIYPSFRYYSKDQLMQWHEIYTRRISLVVVPLMLGQLLFSILEVWFTRELFSFFNLIAALIVWVLTFWLFVPRHQKIAAGVSNVSLLKQLENLNWWRTALWSVIFIGNMLQNFSF
ncbi:MAG TPA: hypothetical protein DDX98_01100 [Bacteroidales bacterium]|jgi:tetrahydromethanopterin S-methyltransferase subunit C|nr:hypothetical protein [Bacteroidales bacterium]